MHIESTDQAEIAGQAGMKDGFNVNMTLSSTSDANSSLTGTKSMSVIDQGSLRATELAAVHEEEDVESEDGGS